MIVSGETGFLREYGEYKVEYIGNKEYWDSKFINRSSLPDPEKSLVENITYLKKGSVLDLACGDGRNALFLAGMGFRVTGVDFSAAALERLRMYAGRKNYCVDTKQIDLSRSDSLRDIGVFDNVLINHYRLGKEQLKEIGRHITDSGTLFICGFGHKHKVDSKIRSDDLIQPTDFTYIKEHFRLIQYIEHQDDRVFFVTYIFRKI
jgi:tellurite methyltransferase